MCVASRFVLQRCCVGFQSWSRLTRTQVLSLVALGGGFSYSASHSPAVLSGSQRGGCDVYSSCFDCVADTACGFCPEPTPAHTAGEAGTGAVSGGEVATVTGYCIAGSAAAPVTAEAAGGGATAMCAVRIIRFAYTQRFFNCINMCGSDTLPLHEFKLWRSALPRQAQDGHNETRIKAGSFY